MVSIMTWSISIDPKDTHIMRLTYNKYLFLERLEGSDHPYFVKRSKNHMLPVYLAVHKISKQKTTVIKHIIGDIWVSVF